MALEQHQPSALPVQQEPFCAVVAALTDVGQSRGNNEDSHLILPLGGGRAPADAAESALSVERPGLLLAVADGMGGHQGGEVASSKCVEYLTREIASHLKDLGSAHPDLASVLKHAVEAAHQGVFALTRDHPQGQKMGTTLTAALISGMRAEIAEVGDSRAYLFRGGNLVLLTQDQTLGNQFRDRGADPAVLSQEIRETLTQALGAQPDIKVVMSAIDLEAQDLLLLCCDGLYKVVSPEELVDILELKIPLAEKAAQLIGRANKNGGPDNITVLLAEIRPIAAAN